MATSSAPGVGPAFSLPRKKSWTRRTTETCRVSGGQVSEMTAKGKRSFPEPRPLPPDPVPSGREVIERVTTLTGEWQLQRAGPHFEIICNGVFLMASYNQPSDRALAALGLRRGIGEGLRVLGGGWLPGRPTPRLYGQQGLMGFLAALRPGGVLAYWSAGPAPRLAKTLASAGASVDAVEVEDQIGPDRRGTAWLYLATKATAHRSPAPGAE